MRSNCRCILFLPRHIPDLNPIGMAFAKLKALLRSTATRTIDGLWKVIRNIRVLFTPQECSDYSAAAGYGFSESNDVLTISPALQTPQTRLRK